MATQAYRLFRFDPKTEDLIATCNEIIEDYLAQGFKLTVRQLYYQLVARDYIPNNERSYKRITNTVNDGRLAGLIDWDAIEDRTRAFVRRTRWDSGQQILRSAVDGFHMDMWANQSERVFVIIEKEALVGVLEPTCHKLDVPLLAARGYPSASVLREFAVEDLHFAITEGQTPVILHLGDHDPSGIDMTRDLQERLGLFAEESVELVRLALNMDQIEERKPPPNPAKTTDARFEDYQRKFGSESWELDALPPSFLAQLTQEAILERIDGRAWKARAKEVESVRSRIRTLAEKFDA